MRMRSRSSCKRISGEVSTSRFHSGKEKSTLGRVRWLRGSSEVQTGQLQPNTGTPVDVPVPRKTIRRGTVAARSSKPETPGVQFVRRRRADHFTSAGPPHRLQSVGLVVRGRISPVESSYEQLRTGDRRLRRPVDWGLGLL